VYIRSSTVTAIRNWVGPAWHPQIPYTARKLSESTPAPDSSHAPSPPPPAKSDIPQRATSGVLTARLTVRIHDVVFQHSGILPRFHQQELRRIQLSKKRGSSIASPKATVLPAPGPRTCVRIRPNFGAVRPRAANPAPSSRKPALSVCLNCWFEDRNRFPLFSALCAISAPGMPLIGCYAVSTE